MVKLTSFMALFTLIIAPTFAAVLPNIETRDVAEPLFFGRDMGGSFAREQDFELPDVARRYWIGDMSNAELVTREVVTDEMSRDTSKDFKRHEPFNRHSLDFLDRKLDHHVDDDMRFLDDLDQ